MGYGYSYFNVQQSQRICAVLSGTYLRCLAMDGQLVCVHKDRTEDTIYEVLVMEGQIYSIMSRIILCRILGFTGVVAEHS